MRGLPADLWIWKPKSLRCFSSRLARAFCRKAPAQVLVEVNHLCSKCCWHRLQTAKTWGCTDRRMNEVCDKGRTVRFPVANHPKTFLIVFVPECQNWPILDKACAQFRGEHQSCQMVPISSTCEGHWSAFKGIPSCLPLSPTSLHNKWSHQRVRFVCVMQCFIWIKDTASNSLHALCLVHAFALCHSSVGHRTTWAPISTSAATRTWPTQNTEMSPDLVSGLLSKSCLLLHPLLASAYWIIFCFDLSESWQLAHVCSCRVNPCPLFRSAHSKSAITSFGQCSTSTQRRSSLQPLLHDRPQLIFDSSKPVPSVTTCRWSMTAMGLDVNPLASDNAFESWVCHLRDKPCLMCHGGVWDHLEGKGTCACLEKCGIGGGGGLGCACLRPQEKGDTWGSSLAPSCTNTDLCFTHVGSGQNSK